MSRRGVLRAGLALTVAGATGGCLGGGTEGGTDGVRVTRHTYGPDPSQFGELYMPTRAAGDLPVVVVVHGGFWRSAYDLSLGTPLARDLAGRGFAAWNLEYRRVGNGGGWPGTLQDVADGIDLLAELAAAGTPLDLGRTVTLGHSAGGHLGVWAAARGGLPAGVPGATPRVRLVGALAQAGVLDLRRAAAEQLGSAATQQLLGGDPAAVPDRYALSSPVERVPLGVPVVCVHGRSDTNVPFSQSQSYVRAATAAGDSAELVPVDGDHFTLIDTSTTAWQVIVERLTLLLGSAPPQPPR